MRKRLIVGLFAILWLTLSATAGTSASATTPEFRLSLKHDGVRASAGEETLRYSPLCDGGSNETAKVTLKQGDAVLSENLTAEGDYAWSVSANGTYNLTHTTYTNGAVAKVLNATFVVTGKDIPFPPGSVTTTGYNGKFDGNGHGITVTTADIANPSITYARTEAGPYTAVNPLFTNVCNETVWYVVAAPGYITQTNSEKVVITNGDIGGGGGEEPGGGEIPEGGLSKFDATYVYDGEGHTIKTNELVAAANAAVKGAVATVTYGRAVCPTPPSAEPPTDIEWVADAPSVTNVGEYVVWYRITAPNYSNYVHAAKVTILAKPYEDCCLTFTSTNAFSFSQNCWEHDGTLQYSTDGSTWQDWNGAALSAVKNADDKFVLMFRGNANTYMQGQYSTPALIGTNVYCEGNIETLLDYRKVARGEHPEMGERYAKNGCFLYTFKRCTALISAPQLPATNLTEGCYAEMFDGCSSLQKAPDLPATALSNHCYQRMFRDCSSLSEVPRLPAKTMANSCCYGMFTRCYSLRSVPELPGTNLVSGCYTKMFAGCTNICLVSQGEGESWQLPSNAEVQCGPLYPENWQIDMFLGCDIDFVTGPQPGTTYYFKRRPVTPDGPVDTDLKTGGSYYDVEIVYDGLLHAINTNRLLQVAYEYQRTTPMRSGHIVYDYRDLDTNVYGEVSVLTNKNLTFSYSLTSNGVYQAEPFVFKDVVTTSYWYKITSPGFANYLHEAQVVITNRPVTLTSASDSKKYDGEALTNHTVTVGGLDWAPNEGATYDVTGSQIDVGSSANTFGYSLNDNTEESNYEITKVEGKLEVTNGDIGGGGGEEPGPGEIPEGGLSKFDATYVYDGEGHTINTQTLFAVTVPASTPSFSFAKDGGGQGLPALPSVPTWVAEAPVYTNVGEYVVWYRITAPNYSNFVHAAKVTISPRSITGVTIAAIGDRTYTGTAIEPIPDVSDMRTLFGMSEPTNIIASTDYDLSYLNNTAPGTATLTLTGRNNYCGTKSTTFVIVATGTQHAALVAAIAWKFNPETAAHTAQLRLACTNGFSFGISDLRYLYQDRMNGAKIKNGLWDSVKRSYRPQATVGGTTYRYVDLDAAKITKPGMTVVYGVQNARPSVGTVPADQRTIEVMADRLETSLEADVGFVCWTSNGRQYALPVAAADGSHGLSVKDAERLNRLATQSPMAAPLSLASLNTSLAVGAMIDSKSQPFCELVEFKVDDEGVSGRVGVGRGVAGGLLQKGELGSNARVVLMGTSSLAEPFKDLEVLSVDSEGAFDFRPVSGDCKFFKVRIDVEQIVK